MLFFLTATGLARALDCSAKDRGLDSFGRIKNSGRNEGKMAVPSPGGGPEALRTAHRIDLENK